MNCFSSINEFLSFNFETYILICIILICTPNLIIFGLFICIRNYVNLIVLISK